MLEKDYPYKGRDMSCKYDENNTSGVKVSSWRAVTPKSVKLMKQAAAT